MMNRLGQRPKPDDSVWVPRMLIVEIKVVSSAAILLLIPLIVFWSSRCVETEE